MAALFERRIIHRRTPKSLRALEELLRTVLKVLMKGDQYEAGFNPIRVFDGR